MDEIHVLETWLREMQGCVRAVDYDRAEKIFADDVVGFGTFEGMATGRQALRAAQWSHVWPAIRDFTFRLDQLRSGVEDSLAWGACPWDSIGRLAEGAAFSRPGRMTVILERRAGQWLAVHTHFSLFPQRDT
jgi:ketosteroid isomerase-like protein